MAYSYPALTPEAMKYPVSVVIPSYNYGRFLPEAIESALRQTHVPREIIVVDDGSTDDTAGIVKPYLARIRYIHQPNAGLSAARNTGIKAAVGTWIAFLDADDTWHPHKLRMQMHCAAMNLDVVVIGALEENSPRAKQCREGDDLFTLLSTRDLLGGLPFGASSTVARRDALIAAGLFDESRRSVEDREMWLKLSLLGKAARVDRPLWNYRIHPNQMNANPGRMAENYKKVLDTFFGEHAGVRHLAPYAYAYFHYDSGTAYECAGLRKQAFLHTLQSFRRYPFLFKQASAERPLHRGMLLLKTGLGHAVFKGLLAPLNWARRMMRPAARPVPAR